MGGPITILHAVVNMNRGGAETLLMNLYRNIDRTKVQFHFLTCKPGVFDTEIEEMGGKIHRIPYVTDVGHSKYIQALDHFFAAYPEYKIVHSHMDKMSGFVLRAAKKADLPVRIAHSHSTKNEGGFVAKTYKWFAGKSILTCATHLLACSTKAAEWLFGDKKEHALILKNGIESDRFMFSPEIRSLVRNELELDPDEFVIGHVGRFSYPKNHAFLLEIFAQFQTVNNKSVLILAGDGPLRLEIEKKAKKLNMGNRIRFLGVRSDVNRLLQAFDVFVFPSWYEGLPVTLIEAQGAGLPCIISDVITREVDMGMDLVEFLPILDTMTWTQKIIDVISSDPQRNNTKTSLSNKGYDIKHTAAWAEGFYLTISR